MRLLFIWIKQDELRVFENCGVNFTEDYFVEYNDDNKILKIIKKEKKLPHDFYSFKEGESVVSQVTCLVGKNGSGKTSLLKHIYKTDVIGDVDYKNMYVNSNTIQVFEFNGKLKIYHNLEAKITLEPEQEYPIYVMNSNRHDVDEILNNGDYSNITKFFLSNDYWVAINSNFTAEGKQSKLAITPYDINVAQSIFFDKISIKQSGLFVCKDEFYRLNEYLKRRANKSYLQKIFYLVLYSKAIDVNASYILNLLCRFNVEFYSVAEMDQFIDCFKLLRIYWSRYKWKTIFDRDKTEKQIFEDIRKAINEDSFDNYELECLQICVIYNFLLENGKLDNFNLYNTLIVETLFNLSKYDNIFEFEKYDVDFLLNRLELCVLNTKDQEKNLVDVKQNEIKYFKGAKESISKLSELLTKYHICDHNSFNLNYSVNAEFVNNFINYFNGELESGCSFVLKYLWGKTGFSSGEACYLNLFSWLSAASYWEYFSNSAFKGMQSNILLMIDEPDSFCHPEWQRKILMEIIKTCESLYQDKKIHLIISTHSSLFLSDIPSQNVISLEQINKQRTLSGSERQTFGSNIFDLYNDSFFLDKFIGEFAYSKINDAIRVINDAYSNNNYSEKSFKNAKLICELIGEPILKNKLVQMIHAVEEREK